MNAHLGPSLSCNVHHLEYAIILKVGQAEAEIVELSTAAVIPIMV